MVLSYISMKKSKTKGKTSKRAFITGISGQDGYYLSKLLVSKGYVVCGLVRDKRAAEKVFNGCDPKIKSHIEIIVGDLSDRSLVREILNEFNPGEIYNLAAISDLATSFKNPEKTMEVNCEAPGKMIADAFKILPNVKMFMASSAQIFDSSHPPQSERTAFKPENPYAVSKLKLHQKYVLPFRKKGLYVCSGFSFNHESPRRKDLVVYKVTSSLVKIKAGKLDCLELGNLETIRDWGYAGDYVEAMWKMLQSRKADDFVIATGKAHTVRELVELTAISLGTVVKWQGQGVNEVGVDKSGRTIVKINPNFYRNESGYYVGDISKIKRKLGWQPRASFRKLVRLMLESRR